VSASGAAAAGVAQLSRRSRRNSISYYALDVLAAGHTENQAAIVAAGAIPPLVQQMLRHPMDHRDAPVEGGKDDVQSSAAYALGSLARDHGENQAIIIATAGAVPRLLELHSVRHFPVAERDCTVKLCYAAEHLLRILGVEAP
jgi:hypothetical protein